MELELSIFDVKFGNSEGSMVQGLVSSQGHGKKHSFVAKSGQMIVDSGLVLV